MEIGLLLLGAGQSLRMGQNKLLLPWKDTVVWHQVLSVYAPWDGPKLAVINDDDPSIYNACERYGFSTCVNMHPSLGQGLSVGLGLKTWQKMGLLERLDGVLCAVGDQPLVTVQLWETLRKTFIKVQKEKDRQKAIICPSYDGKRGNPVLFGKSWFPHLEALRGDEGGRAIIRGPGQDSLILVQADPACGMDMDTPEAYTYLYDTYGKGLVKKEN